MKNTPRAPGDIAASIGVAILASAVVFAALLHTAGTLTAAITSAQQPRVDLAGSLAGLAQPASPGTALGTPKLPAVAYWSVVAAMTIVVCLVTVLGWRLITRIPSPAGRRGQILGAATRADVKRYASSHALMRRAGTLRPSLPSPRPADVGFRLGAAHGHGVWTSVEDSLLLLGPPRSGKGMSVVIPAILDAPGPVITTSTRPDNLTTTLTARSRGGPVVVFDPQRLAGVEHGSRWSPVRGCHDPYTAMVRAAGLAASTGLGGNDVENGSFWQGLTKSAIQGLLHAAALDHREADTLFRWSLSPANAADAVHILRSTNSAADGWADSLDAMITADPRTRDSIWHGVAQAFSALADPRVLDTLAPRAGQTFDPVKFLSHRGTLYLLATSAGANACGPLVAAFVEDVVEVARRIAARSPGARLDPPLTLILDEIAHIAFLPSLATWMAEGGGSGIATWPVLQSLAQARDRWGQERASAIWDASITKVLLGGTSNAKDLHDLSTIIGERDEHTDTVSRDPTGARSIQRSIRRVPIMPPETLRTLPPGTGAVMLRSTPPIITTMRPWTSRPDAQTLQRDRHFLEQRLQSDSA